MKIFRGGGQSKNKQCVDTVAVCRDDNVSRIPSAESNKRKTLIELNRCATAFAGHRAAI